MRGWTYAEWTIAWFLIIGGGGSMLVALIFWLLPRRKD